MFSNTDSSARFHAWVQERIDVAKRLNEGECGGTYAEAILILSSILSGIAADMWPGTGKDRRRFVELWANYTSSELKPNLISVPLLLDTLDADGLQDLAAKVRGTRPNAFYPPGVADMRIVTGEYVDQSETELKKLDTRLTSEKLRSFSYGSVFYKHVRSGYTHEYHTTDFASRYPMTSKRALVSYVNYATPPHRRIHFDVAWVAKLAESVSASVVPIFHQQPIPDPKLWWVEG